jgi:hypothetical protein
MTTDPTGAAAADDALDLDSLPDYTSRKRGIVIGLVVFELVMGLLDARLDPRVSLWIGMCVVNIGVLWWVYYDALEFNRPLTTGWRIAILAIAGVAVPVHFIQTRGWRRGMLSIGKCLLLLLGIGVLQAVLMLAFNLA